MRFERRFHDGLAGLELGLRAVDDGETLAPEGWTAARRARPQAPDNGDTPCCRSTRCN